MSLVQEVGERYMAERFAGCMFLNADNKVCLINTDKRSNHWGPESVRVTAVSGPVSKLTVEDVQVPTSFFKDLSVFKVPPLGWRTTNGGRYMAYFSRNNESYMRAVSVSNLIKVISQPTRYLINTGVISGEHYGRETATALLVLQPEYVKFRDGIQQMREGSILSFAVNQNVAVVPAADDKQYVYFNLKRVAVVEPDDSITCQDPVIKDLIKGLEV